MPEPQTGVSCTLLLADAEALRDHLDALNDDGQHPVAVGLDDLGQPFLIALVGPYADGEHVLLDSPWQREVTYSTGHTYCDECLGHVHGIEHLRYPVAVLTRTSASGDYGTSKPTP